MRLLFISCNKYVIVNTKIAKCCKMLENKNECQWHNKMNNSILTHFLQLGNDKLAFQGTKINYTLLLKMYYTHLIVTRDEYKIKTF